MPPIRKKIPLIDQAANLNVTGTVTLAGSGAAVITFPSVTATLATTAELALKAPLISPVFTTPTLGVASTTSLAVTGTAGAGFLSLVGQSANPTSPAAGTLILHSSTANGFTRLEQDNESATNLVYGRDNVIIAKNVTVAIITKGSTVYVTGSAGNVPTIANAQANSNTTLPAIGVVLNDIAVNGFGQVMTVGIVSSLNTSTFAVGAPVWVSETVAGGLTATRPSGIINSAQRVGSILVSGIGNGSLMVDISPSVLNMETGTNSATWTGRALAGTSLNLSALTASQILGTDASKNLVSLPVATYPSLAELAFVKGLTSNAQTQITARITASSTDTLTNKRPVARIFSTPTTATLTPDKASYDILTLTAQSGALTIANPTVTPNDGDQTRIRIYCPTTIGAITFGTNYVAKGGSALPTTTILVKNMEMGFEFNSALGKYNLLALSVEA